MMDAQDNADETTPAAVIVNPHGLDLDSAIKIAITPEDQMLAAQKVDFANALMAAAGKPVEEIVKMNYAMFLGLGLALSDILSIADVRAIISDVLLPTLDRYEHSKLESALADVEPVGNA